MVHAVRAAMHSLKKTGTDFTSAQGMDPKSFFEVMGTSLWEFTCIQATAVLTQLFLGLNEVVELDAKAGGSAFQVV